MASSTDRKGTAMNVIDRPIRRTATQIARESLTVELEALTARIDRMAAEIGATMDRGIEIHPDDWNQFRDDTHAAKLMAKRLAELIP